MAFLSLPRLRVHPRLADLWRGLQSRYVLGGGYALAVLLTVLAIVLAVSPPQKGPLTPTSTTVLTVLGLNLVLILALGGLLAWRLVGLVHARASDAGARLHLRFVTQFAVAAVLPALAIALSYGVLVNRGIETWFDKRVETLVENSATVARSYLDDKKTDLGEKVNLMALDLNREAEALHHSPVTFSQYLEAQATYRELSGAYLVDREGQVLAKAEMADAPAFVLPSAKAFAAADEGDIWMALDSAGLLRAVFRLQAYPDAYLYVVRPVEGAIINHLNEAYDSVVAYREAARSREQIQAIFALSYVETALLVLVGAVWLGMSAANAISAPVSRLVQAAGHVAGGDLNVRVDAERDPEEIAVLSRAFNKMTHDLQVQQAALSRAREEAESRRQFIETVLSEVSAGVMGLDAEGRISAGPNRQAAILLALDPAVVRGRPLSEAAPEFAEIAAGAGVSGEAEAEVDVVRGRDSRRLRVRARRSEGGLVLTFDDITRLAAAQRNAAWKDVARRIAHEIKNPLTPIQLSAERLRRKYRKIVPPDDLETFDRCTDTIVRQVGDIGRMVDEFSAFARMPAPKFSQHDAAELLRAGVFAQRVAAPDVKVELKEPVPAAQVLADGRMLAQALTNVLKNAAEAIAARRQDMAKLKGQITAELVSDDQGVAFVIEDNGVGLPAKDRDRLTEPYVTTREKGTGLGLAIVKRILEDHGGELVLTDAAGGQGARVTLRLPASARATAPEAALAAAEA